MGKSLMRDRNVHPSKQQYHPYVNSPSLCQRIFEIACLVLILASVPAFLGGVYSIFVSGYGAALGLLGLLTFGTRRHTCAFLAFAILFFIFVIVVIILNAIDPIGKYLPFTDDFNANINNSTNGTNNNNFDNDNNRRSLYIRQDTTVNGTYCGVLPNCTLDLNNVGQLDDGQIRLNFGTGASDVAFRLANGYLFDDQNRTCYISGQTQLQCNFAPQTTDYDRFCVNAGRLSYNGNTQWWRCPINGGYNVYTTELYDDGACSTTELQVISNRCKNSTDGSDFDGNAATGGAFVNNVNGTNNSTTNSTSLHGGAFEGSRVYAYIDSGIILATTLLAIIAAFFVAGEFRPAPGTLNHTSTTSTTTRPVTSAPAGGYAPVNTGNAATVGGANYATGASTLGSTGAATGVHTDY